MSSKYRRGGPWNDYILINNNYRNIDTDSSSESEYYSLIPSKLIGFIHVSEDKPIQAIVHVCHETAVEESVLTLRWKLKFVGDKICTNNTECPYTDNTNLTNCTPIFQLVDLDNITGHTLIIPYDCSSKFLIQVKDYQIWADLFQE